MRAAILSLGWIGTLVFAALWLLSWWQPIVVERAARELIRIEVQKKVDGKLDALSETSLAGLARAALRRTDIELDRAKVRAEVAARVADMLDEDCACRRRLSEGTRTIMAGWRDALVRERGQLAALIEAGYASVRASLLREFRIFTASNAVAFALLALVTRLRQRAGLQLLLPAVVLVGAVLLAGGLYLFNQDWLHTIVFGDYLGLGYAAYLALVAAMLADIAFNRARVINVLLNALGAAVAPC